MTLLICFLISTIVISILYLLQNACNVELDNLELNFFERDLLFFRQYPLNFWEFFSQAC